MAFARISAHGSNAACSSIAIDRSRICDASTASSGARSASSDAGTAPEFPADAAEVGEPPDRPVAEGDPACAARAPDPPGADGSAAPAEDGDRCAAHPALHAIATIAAATPTVCFLIMPVPS